jgi:DNA polymerase-3 subunit delta
LHTTVFAFTDALSERRAKESITLLQELITFGEDPFMVFAMIMRQCRLLFAFKEEKDPEGLAKLLKLHPFVVKKLHTQKNKFTKEQLQHMLGTLRTIDRQMKTGEIRTLTGDAEELLGALERFIVVDVCGKG